MRVFLRCRQVLLVAKELIGIEQTLVHTTMLAVEKTLKSIVVDLGYQVGTPVAQLAEHLLGLLAVAIEIGITQTC